MKNYIQPGEVIDFANTTGADIASGQAFLVGDKLAVAEVDIANGTTGTAAICGVFSLPKDDTAGAQGAAAYWDDAAGAITDTDNAGANKRVGIFHAAAAAGDATANVKLNGE